MLDHETMVDYRLLLQPRRENRVRDARGNVTRLLVDTEDHTDEIARAVSFKIGADNWISRERMEKLVESWQKGKTVT